MRPLRFSRRSNLRPTSNIAFRAASAAALTPAQELCILRSRISNQSQLSLSTLKRLLQSLHVDDELFAEALFELADLQNAAQVQTHHLFILYALLRRVAFAQPETLSFALQDIVYFIFTSVAGSEAATSVSWMQWFQFASKLATAVGGPDSLPCEQTQSQLRSAWRGVAMFPIPVTFPKFVNMLRKCDGGLLLNIRAIAFILVSSVVLAAHPSPQLPVWNEPIEESRFLSQFVTHMIETRVSAPGDLCCDESTSSSENRESPPYQRLQMGAGMDSPDRKPESKLLSINHNVGQERGGLWSQVKTFSDRVEAPSLRPRPFSFPQSGHSHVASKAIARSVANVSRSKCSKAKTPFHIDFSSITLGEKLGSGAYGDVYRGTFLMTPVAIKVFHINIERNTHMMENENAPPALTHMSTINKLQKFASSRSQTKYRNFVREVEMMSVVRHPNLVLYMGACGDPFTPLCIVSELFTGGSLYEYLHNDAEYCPDPYLAVSFALCIARGMFYLHSSEPSILHRDLKSTNVLLSERKGNDGIPQVVICDFGQSQLFGYEEEFEMSTAFYMSPNVISREKYEKTDDIYSFGILLHEIFTGSVPFEGLSPTQVMFQVVHQGLRPSSDRDGGIPAEIEQLIDLCWNEDKAKRPLFCSIISRLESFEAHVNCKKTENESSRTEDFSPVLQGGLLPLENGEFVKKTSITTYSSDSL